jgi:transcriptional regulator with XRE-family HTH domain
MRIGETIKAKRLEKGWNQSGLARALDTNQSAVSNWEKDLYFPEPQYVPKLCALLNIDPQWLSEQIAKAKTEKDREKSAIESLESRLLSAFGHLSLEQRKSVVVSLEERVASADLAAEKLKR